MALILLGRTPSGGKKPSNAFPLGTTLPPASGSPERRVQWRADRQGCPVVECCYATTPNFPTGPVLSHAASLAARIIEQASFSCFQCLCRFYNHLPGCSRSVGWHRLLHIGASPPRRLQRLKQAIPCRSESNDFRFPFRATVLYSIRSSSAAAAATPALLRLYRHVR